MAASTLSAPSVRTGQPSWLRHAKMAALIFVPCLCVGVIAVSYFWPFTLPRVVEKLQESSDSRVQVRSFHHTYFPYPGCVLEGVSFVHDAAAGRPLATIERLRVLSTYPALFGRHIRLMKAEGLHIFIPPIGTGKPFQLQPSTLIVDTMSANGATIEIASRNPQKHPLRFDVHDATFRAVGAPGPMLYRVRVHNPEPPGEVSAEGELGDWDMQNPAETVISGKYKFENTDLGVYGGIGGTLSSEGKFSGKLGHIGIAGATDVPNFEVSSGRHPVDLTSQFSAYVDAIHGDTYLERVDAHFRRTEVIALGNIAGSHDRDRDGQAKGNGEAKGKIAHLSLSAVNGRIEDILGLFVSAKRSPMSGVATMHADVEIPPGQRPFLEKLKLRGTFGIGGGEFSNANTQEGVNKLSAGAQGEKDTSDPETVLTDLAGKVSADNGIATFTGLSYGIPGAAARMHGTYGLSDHKIDLHGQMQVRTKISNTETGAKALLLRLMDPFFKKREKGEILPVRIGGTYEKPSFGLDLHDPRAQTVRPPGDPPSH